MCDNVLRDVAASKKTATISVGGTALRFVALRFASSVALARVLPQMSKLGPRDGSEPGAGHAHIIAVVNQKGGVGKTTTSVNLAASMAAAERRTLLVDLDPQANASSGVGVSPRTLERSVYDVLIARATLRDVMVRTELPTLTLVPSKQDLVAVEVELVDDRDRAHKLHHALRELLHADENEFEYIIVDCPPSLGILTVNALAAADTVLVPMQCEYYALEGLTSLMATIDRVRAGMNARLELEGIVLTMFDPRNNLAHQVAEEVRRHFHVFESVIPRNVRLSEAPSHGKPALLYDVQSKGAQGYLSLAHEILAREASLATARAQRLVR
jgi:chromosome partitioning protein